MAHRLLAKQSPKTEDYDEIATDIWFNRIVKNYDVVVEESMRLKEHDQCLPLIWFDASLKSVDKDRDYDVEDDEPLLEELDGKLPWPSKRHRK